MVILYIVFSLVGTNFFTVDTLKASGSLYPSGLDR